MHHEGRKKTSCDVVFIFFAGVNIFINSFYSALTNNSYIIIIII